LLSVLAGLVLCDGHRDLHHRRPAPFLSEISMTRPIFNIADLTEFREVGHKGQAIGATRPDQSYEARLGAISTKIGAQKLGYNLTIVPPGKRAFPRHSHRVNEEMFFIIEGEGEVRVGKESYPV